MLFMGRFSLHAKIDCEFFQKKSRGNSKTDGRLESAWRRKGTQTGAPQKRRHYAHDVYEKWSNVFSGQIYRDVFACKNQPTYSSSSPNCFLNLDILSQFKSARIRTFFVSKQCQSANQREKKNIIYERFFFSSLVFRISFC